MPAGSTPPPCPADPPSYPVVRASGAGSGRMASRRGSAETLTRRGTELLLSAPGHSESTATTAQKAFLSQCNCPEALSENISRNKALPKNFQEPKIRSVRESRRKEENG